MGSRLIIGFITALLVNAAGFAGLAISFRKPPADPEPEARIIEMILEDELVPPPEVVDTAPSDMPEGSGMAVDEALASLPEPPPSVVLDGAITEIFRPTPPVPPRPDALMKSFIPSRRPEGTGAGGTTALGPNIFSILELDRRPQVRVRPVPVYPAELRRQGIGGSATIRIQVDEEGTVFDAVVLNASHPEFGRAARDAALRIRMTPGTRNGQPVRFTFDAPYAFDPG